MKIQVIILSVLLLSACDFWNVDKCLDNGGKWNYEQKVCEFE